ncbi:MAG: ATPase, partial [Thermodesulfobacteriota bacterium]
MLQQRKTKVSGLQEDIDSFSQTAQEKDEAYYSGIRAARAKGLKEKEKYVQAAEDEEREIITRIN